ncbi:ParB/RepB/Spo0J family partition protein [Pseudomonas putida]|nr:ParB/RepB/Spo0J family partition protein [Pseudomonas putida]
MTNSVTAAAPPPQGQGVAEHTLTDILVSKIAISPYQPRLVFDKQKLQELSESIREVGLLRPILVRTIQDGYELIGGERRWRAVTALKWETVPAIITEMSDALAKVCAVSDNTGEPLTDYESALAYHKILANGEYRSQSELAAALGINRSTVSRCLQLVELPEPIQAILRERPDLITSNYAKQFVEYSRENQNVVVRVINGAMLRSKIGQVGALKIIGQKLSACTRPPQATTPKVFKGIGTLKRSGSKFEFSCEKNVDLDVLIGQFSEFLEAVDLSALCTKRASSDAQE